MAGPVLRGCPPLGRGVCPSGPGLPFPAWRNSSLPRRFLSPNGGPSGVGLTSPGRGHPPSVCVWIVHPRQFLRGSSLPPKGLSPSPPVSPALRAASSARSRRKTVRSGRSPRRRCPGSAAKRQRETAAVCGQAPGPAPHRPAPPAPYPKRPAPGPPCCGSPPPRSARTGCADPPPPSPRSAPPSRRHLGKGHTPLPPPPPARRRRHLGRRRERAAILGRSRRAGPYRQAAAARPSRLYGCDPQEKEQKEGR